MPVKSNASFRMSFSTNEPDGIVNAVSLSAQMQRHLAASSRQGQVICEACKFSTLASSSSRDFPSINRPLRMTPSILRVLLISMPITAYSTGCTGRSSASALGNRFARCKQAKIAGLLQGSECEVTIAILTDDDSPVHLIGTRAWIE